MDNNEKKVYVLLMNTEAADCYYSDYQSVTGVFTTHEKALEAAKKLDNIYFTDPNVNSATYHGCEIAAYTLDHLYKPKEADN